MACVPAGRRLQRALVASSLSGRVCFRVSDANPSLIAWAVCLAASKHQSGGITPCT